MFILCEKRKNTCLILFDNLPDKGRKKIVIIPIGRGIVLTDYGGSRLQSLILRLQSPLAGGVGPKRGRIRGARDRAVLRAGEDEGQTGAQHSGLRLQLFFQSSSRDSFQMRPLLHAPLPQRRVLLRHGIWRIRMCLRKGFPWRDMSAPDRRVLRLTVRQRAMPTPRRRQISIGPTNDSTPPDVK
ncbi:hypothetical protein evm_010314 [Chilo suppressalis]|nr:hypothetical protein evm_010314 [Chilo suppressalis]